MTARILFAASLLFLPCAAWAQDDEEPSSGASIGETISVDRDTEFQAADQDEICAAETGDEIVITLTTNDTCFDCQAYVWWLPGSATDCTGAAPTETISTTKLTFTGNSTITFPGDDFDNIEEFTEYDVFFQAEACPGEDDTGLIDTEVTLCIAIDAYGNDNQIDTNDPHGWITFEIDTEPPPAPVIDEWLIEVGDKEIKLPLSISGSGTDDVLYWLAWYREAPMIENEAGEEVLDPDVMPCLDWPQVGRFETEQEATATMAISANIKNGVTYEICVRAEDDATNIGPPSATVRATPRDECDFFECYPRDLKTGYCAAASGPSLLFLFLFALFRWRGGRR